ncbi:NAD(P)/FAD-dependent oxidoreductase [Ferrimonas sp. SCSIO 43195]|uniref:NAD(P)/FAD-dependent oxidoreductase n=1 Tax=Ferrimonas sp. SCSIO 43195 TaxID=2822844 RepID=UPI00207629D1|nr:tryptophan 7-halogenase [Ferrimonas sp. SCSIO 43195]USD36090.1 tryptophan 7-halogenase [Ferrimonas sp. SCSIO 43195]
MRTDNDVTILGAGPAGLATALSLHQQAPWLKVEILDAADAPQFKLGETLPPAAGEVLSRLLGEDSRWLLRSQQVCSGSISIWQQPEPGHNDFFFDLSGPGYHLDRARFESELASQLKRRDIGLRRRVKVQGVQPQEDCVALTIAAQPRPLHSRFVVDASGGARQVCRALGVADNTLDEVVYLCAVLPLTPGGSMTDRTLVEAQSYGWWYAARLPEQKVMLMLCCDKASMATASLADPAVWLQRAEDNRLFQTHLAPVLAAARAEGLTLLRRSAPSGILSNVVGRHWLAVGDCASRYDPISSAGITKALMHGELAGQSIADYLQRPDVVALLPYQQQVFDDFNQYLQLRHSLYASVQRFGNQPFWHNRATAMG